MIMPEKNPKQSEIVLYQTEDGRTQLEVRLENETVWLTQGQMAELFQTTIPNISMHIRNVFSEGELKPDSVVKESLTTGARNQATGAQDEAGQTGEEEKMKPQRTQRTQRGNYLVFSAFSAFFAVK